ncbi:GGDEF domain-containing protein [Pseudomonas segetis]|uniref:diguanylate cyclase n=1 Tax=Pseudomonas segetis TaxID=298908 RepID=A0A239AF65_9PSED|nr:diguanylate cyclase [Pseudomonas segetis]SNR93694.1 diguanylate cyclase (GGDEF) domain-containing protein [Pseudomonas segetis]
MPNTDVARFQANQRRMMAVLVVLVLVMAVIVGSALWMVVRQAETLATPALHSELWRSHQANAQIRRTLSAALAYKQGNISADDLTVQIQVLRSITRTFEKQHVFRFLPVRRPSAEQALNQVIQLSKDWDERAAWGDPIGADIIADEISQQLPGLLEPMIDVLVSANISLSNELDDDRQKLHSSFLYLGWSLLGLLIGSALLVARLIVSYLQVRQLSLRLGDLNQNLEARVEERTQELSEEQALLNYILEASPSDVALLNAKDSQVHFVNERLLKRSGIKQQQDFSINALFAHPGEGERFHEALEARRQINDWEALLAGEQPYWGVVSGRVLDQIGRTSYLIWSYDISVRKQMEQELLTLANTDSLTGINNRHAFMQLAEDSLKLNHRYRRQCAALMIDIDHFKQINDVHGHQVGDLALQAAAQTLVNGLREVDVLGRLGGEEFAILLPETDFTQARQVAERLRKNIENMQVLLPSQNTLSMTVSIGLAMNTSQESLDHLLGRADSALYQAKTNGRNRLETAGEAAFRQKL